MGTDETILAVLGSDSGDPEEALQELIPKDGWEAVRDSLYRVLLNKDLADHATAAAADPGVRREFDRLS